MEKNAFRDLIKWIGIWTFMLYVNVLPVNKLNFWDLNSTHNFILKEFQESITCFQRISLSVFGMHIQIEENSYLHQRCSSNILSSALWSDWLSLAQCRQSLAFITRFLSSETSTGSAQFQSAYSSQPNWSQCWARTFLTWIHGHSFENNNCI